MTDLLPRSTARLCEDPSRLSACSARSMSSLHQHNDLFWNPAEKAPLLLADDVTDGSSTDTKGSPSRFERVITTYPPILESLLAQLPTLSILDLFHTSTHLRSFLCSYPLAWKTLSFRLPQPALTSVLGSPGNETPDGRDRQSKQYALDGLLIQVVVPFGTRLKNLDLCNTAVTGDSLTSRVLRPRISTIEHLSVRGCKNVSIKYQLLPFLEPYAQGLPWAPRGELALKSLYTYRCRHHRRRPYLPSSLVRRDSDSEPTHQLIEICHKLGIWTDTAWCPTPGGRCFRRKDYYAGRAALGSAEVWVPFDRLWRSGNRIGPGEDGTPIGRSKGTIWEDMETGHDGEALGTSDGPFFGEGKDVPAHLRQSHRLFVEDVKCDQCGDAIMERCEQCSIRMHCMGCRKTLCASCAFNRPIPRKRAKTRHFTSLAWGGSMHTGMESSTSSAAGSPAPQSRRPVRPKTNRFWWAPGATRSPNLMNETTQGDDSSDSEDGGHQPNATLPPFNQGPPPKLNTRWCCLEPIFSGGGGIAVLGPGVGGRGADRVRAAPLPKTKEFEDPDFNCPLKYVDPSREAHIRELKNHAFYGYHLGQEIDLVKYLTQDHLDLQATTCPRNLCQDCYRSFRWKVSCRKCMGAICKEHDFRALKVRRCGYRNLEIERDFIRNQPQQLEYYIPPFKIASSSSGTSTPTTEASSSLKAPSLVSNLGQSKPNASTHNLSLGQPSQESSPAKTWKSSSTPSSSRARSLSESGSSGRSPLSALVFNSYTHVSQRPITPGHPRHPVQWEGCGAYFCQASRPVGDCRMKCNAVIKECADCGVNVCEVSARSCCISFH